MGTRKRDKRGVHRTPLFLWAALAALWAATAWAAPEPLVIDDFEAGLTQKWEERQFKGRTHYEVVADEAGNHVLRAEADGAASGLFHEVELDPEERPLLSWRWKVEKTLAAGDARVKAADDYAARVYVVFPGWIPLATRSLNYIWANKLPKGTHLPNTYYSKAIMIAVESGDEHAGQWRAVTRDIVADYKAVFGEAPGEIGAIAIMTDTDQTGERAVAWYDDIILAPRAP